MIGGIVIEVAELEDRVWIRVSERETNDTCAIYVEKSAKARCVQVGDQVWWQGQFALWTPASNKGMKEMKAGRHYDIRLKRMGYSGVSRPNAKAEASR